MFCTYRNEALQSFAVLFLKSAFDVPEVNLRARDDDAYQCLILGAYSSHGVMQPFSKESNLALHTPCCIKPATTLSGQKY